MSTPWPSTSLGSVADLIMGQAPPGNATNFDGIGAPFVKAGEFGEKFPVIREWTTRPLRLGKDGDVFICVVGATAGKLNLGIDCAIGRSVAAIRPRECLDTSFLYYQLIPHVQKLRTGATGSAQGVLSKPVLQAIEIVLPPLNEQRRIVARLEEILARSQKAKSAYEGVLADAVDLSAAILLDSLTANGLLQAPSDLLASGNVTGLPRGWTLKQLGELVIDGPKNGYSPASDPDATGTLTLRLSATTTGRMILNELTTKRLGEVVADDSPLWLKPGDLLVQRANTIQYVGTAVVYDGPEKTYVYPDLMSRLRFRERELAEWVACLLKSRFGREWVRLVATGTAGNMPKINGASLRRMWVPLPPQDTMLTLLRRALEAGSRVATLVESTKDQMIEVQRLEQGLLRQAFAGRL